MVAGSIRKRVINIELNEYQEQCRRTQREDLPLWATREHALYGLAAEVGEIHSLHQKVHQGRPMDDQALMLEVGDAMWMICELLDCYGMTLEEVAQANIEKLRIRYKKKFTVEECEKRVDTKEHGIKARHYAKGEGRRG